MLRGTNPACPFSAPLPSLVTFLFFWLVLPLLFLLLLLSLPGIYNFHRHFTNYVIFITIVIFNITFSLLSITITNVINSITIIIVAVIITVVKPTICLNNLHYCYRPAGVVILILITKLIFFLLFSSFALYNVSLNDMFGLYLLIHIW